MEESTDKKDNKGGSKQGRGQQIVAGQPGQKKPRKSLMGRALEKDVSDVTVALDDSKVYAKKVPP